MRNHTPVDVINRLKGIARSSIRRGHYERALSAISNAGQILYYWNQYFVDRELEEYLLSLSSLMIKPEYSQTSGEKNTILFYDGFGDDVRGLAAIYLKGFVQLNYRVIYLVNENRKNNQPSLYKMLEDADVV